MTPSKPTKRQRLTATDVAKRLDIHDIWEKAEQTKLDDRLDRMEQAVITLNHASEKFGLWQAEVSADLRWLKLLIGATAVAAFGQLVVMLITGK